MAFIQRAVSPRNEHTQNSGVTGTTLATGAILHRWRANTAIDFQDDIAVNNGSFAYVLEGTGSGQAQVKLRVNGGPGNTSYSFTPIIGDWNNTITRWDFTTTNLLFHYNNGVDLTGGGLDISSASLLSGTWLHKVVGSTIVPREYEHEEFAIWENALPTDSDIASYQGGTALESLSVPPTRFFRPVGPNGAYVEFIYDENDGTNFLQHTQGPTSGGSEPVYSGAVDSVTLPTIPRVIGVTGNTDNATFSISGAYTGQEPDDIQIRVTESGVALAGFDWTTVTSFGSNVWSHTFTGLPAGAAADEYVIQIRSLDVGDSEIASASSTSTNVGIAMLSYGQSNMTRQANTPSPAVTPSAGCFVDSGSGASQGGNAIQALANQIGSRTGKATLVYFEGQGATPIADLVPGSTIWDTRVEALLADSINVNGMVYVQGESDINTAPATYKAELDKYITRMLAISGQSVANFTFLEAQTGRLFGDTYTYSTSWVQIRETQKEWSGETAGAYFATTTIDAEHAPDGGEPHGFDPFHYSNEWYAYDLNPRIAKTYANRLGLSSSDGTGPFLTSFYIDGSDIRARVNLNGATSLTSTGAGNLTGLKLWADNTFTTEVPISASSIDGIELLITPAVAPTESMVLANFRETSPIITNSVVGTGYDINDIGLQMGVANSATFIPQQTATASATAPAHTVSLPAIAVTQQVVTSSATAPVHVVTVNTDPVQISQQTAALSATAPAQIISIVDVPHQIAQSSANAAANAPAHTILIGEPPARVSTFTIKWV